MTAVTPGSAELLDLAHSLALCAKGHMGLASDIKAVKDAEALIRRLAAKPDEDGHYGLYFEPSGDGMGACIHDANGAIICEAKYDDFGNDPSEPERIMKQLVATAAAPGEDRALVEIFERNLPDLVEKYRDTIKQTALSTTGKP